VIPCFCGLFCSDLFGLGYANIVEKPSLKFKLESWQEKIIQHSYTEKERLLKLTSLNNRLCAFANIATYNSREKLDHFLG